MDSLTKVAVDRSADHNSRPYTVDSGLQDVDESGSCFPNYFRCVIPNMRRLEHKDNSDTDAALPKKCLIALLYQVRL